MSYQLEDFIADTQSLLTQDASAKGREAVRRRLELLLANQDFVARYCGEDAAPGVHVLYEDPRLGFLVLAHINEKEQQSPPHDHGASWAIYGQAVAHTDVVEWTRRDDGSVPDHADIAPARSYRLAAGQAGIYQDGMIHSVASGPHSRYIRVTGTNLDNIRRLRFEPKTGRVRVTEPPRAA